MKYSTLLVLIGLTFSSLYAQTTDSLRQKTLNEQFKEMRESSETYRVYKMIKQNELNNFWNAVMDSIKNDKARYAESQLIIAGQEQKLGELNNTINSKDEEITGLQHDTEHIKVLGIDFSKGSYISITFFIILGLIAAIGILFQRFSNSNKVASQKTSDYEKLDKEFENYKKDSLEKQMKLRRDLQTERNKLEEIRNS